MTEVRLVGPDAWAPCMAIRRTVFIEGQGVPEDIEQDGRDSQCLHWLATVDGVPQGTARMRTDGSDGVAQRVAVLASARGTGVGKALMRAMEDEARRRGLARIRLHAQATAIGFYEAIGYTAFGPEFVEAGIVHREMALIL